MELLKKRYKKTLMHSSSITLTINYPPHGYKEASQGSIWVASIYIPMPYLPRRLLFR